VVMFNGNGFDYAAEIVAVGKKAITLEVKGQIPTVPESPLDITVVQAISRGERMDQTLQKCTELGAAAFRPLFSERVEVKLQGKKLASRLEHWRAVIVSACEQCGRAVVPEILAPMQLAQWLSLAEPGPRLALAPGAETALARVACSGRVAVLAGPEGGFSDVETELIKSSGVLAVSLGPRILRTETAAATAVAVLQSLAGDFR